MNQSFALFATNSKYFVKSFLQMYPKIYHHLEFGYVHFSSARLLIISRNLPKERAEHI